MRSGCRRRRWCPSHRPEAPVAHPSERDAADLAREDAVLSVLRGVDPRAPRELGVGIGGLDDQLDLPAAAGRVARCVQAVVGQRRADGDQIRGPRGDAHAEQCDDGQARAAPAPLDTAPARGDRELAPRRLDAAGRAASPAPRGSDRRPSCGVPRQFVGGRAGHRPRERPQPAGDARPRRGLGDVERRGDVGIGALLDDPQLDRAPLVGRQRGQRLRQRGDQRRQPGQLLDPLEFGVSSTPAL